MGTYVNKGGLPWWYWRAVARRRKRRHAYDETANILFAEMAALGADPDADWKAAYNKAVLGLKTAGTWDLIGLFQFYAAHAEAVTVVNWKDPAGVKGSLVNLPVFTAGRGIQTNGSSSYIDAGLPTESVPGWTQNGASAAIYIETQQVSGPSYPVGQTNTGTRRFALSPRDVNGFVRGELNSNAAAAGTTPVANRLGSTVAVRTASAIVRLYRNGAFLEQIASNSTAFSGFGNITIGRQGSNHSSDRYAYFWAGASLSDQQAIDTEAVLAELISAVQALAT